MSQLDQVWHDLQAVREQVPLVHNITNFVVMNNTANALLSLGAAPVMAHAVEEVEEMVAIASALVINIGTLSEPWIGAMKLAMKAAQKKGIPVIFDPVGAGATSYRTETCQQLMEAVAPTIIRGNASEIMSLGNANVSTRGVDSSFDGTDAASAAQEMAHFYRATVVVSGATDLVTDGTVQRTVTNGHPLMPRVTGLGCTASALVGAFAAVNADSVQASVSAMTVLGVCGEIAAAKAAGPGSLQMHLLDSLYSLDQQQLAAHIK